MSATNTDFVPFLPGPPTATTGVSADKLNAALTTTMPASALGAVVAPLVDGLVPLDVVPPLTSANLTDFAPAAANAAPVQSVAGLTGSPTASQIAALLPSPVAGTPKGLYNATTNTPTLSAAGGGGAVGDTYTVSVAGTPSFDAIGALAIGNRIQCVNISSGVNKWVAVVTPQGAQTFSTVQVDSVTFSGGASGFTTITLYPWVISDGSGYIGAYLDMDGVLYAKSTAIQNFTRPINAPAGSALGGFTVSSTDAYDLAIADLAGWVVAGVYNGVWFDNGTGSGGPSATSYSATEIATRNARSLALSSQIRGQVDSFSTALVYTYNHIIVYGQSLSSGWEGWPALSTTAKYDTLMFGGSPRPVTENATTWVPVGSATLQPLIEVNQTNPAGAIVSAAAAAGLTPGDFTLGETVAFGATNQLRRLQLNAKGLAADPSHLLVTSSCGVGGKTMAQLAKGASPELFNRLRGCATAVRTAALAAGGTYGVGALIFMQGEYDYTAGTALADYQAAVQQFYADFQNDISVGIAGQATPPAIFTYQTNMIDTRDTIAVGQAQLNSALTQPGWYLAAPDYPVTDKLLHLDPNGYRWMGAQIGKVMYRVLVERKKWLPLYPTQITYRGKYILVDFHVPEPPLAFDLPWSGSDTGAGTQGPATLQNQGFTVYDDIGIVPIASVTIVGDAEVLIALGRTLSTNPGLKYADSTHNGGNGGLRDSDPTMSDSVYSWTSGNGQYPADNIPALVGKPYPLQNWCVAFNMPITAG